MQSRLLEESQQKVLDEIEDALQDYPNTYRIIKRRPVAVPPEFVKLFGAEGAILFTQMFWRQYRSFRSLEWADDWMPWSNTEITKETGLGRRQQERARRRLAELRDNDCPLVEESKAGVHNRTHFKINRTVLEAVVSRYQWCLLWE